MNRDDAARVLALPVDATAEAVHARYRELARRTHPDAGGSPALWEQVAEAHRVLTDVRTAVAVPRPRRSWCPSPALMVAALILVGVWAGARALVPGGSPQVAAVIALALVAYVHRAMRPRPSAPAPRRSSSTAVVRR